MISENTLQSHKLNHSSLTKKFAAGTTLIFIGSMLSACSTLATFPNAMISTAMNSTADFSLSANSGSILIARPAPRISPNVMYAAGTRPLGSEPRMLGYAPSSTNGESINYQTPIAKINRASSTIKMTESDDFRIVSHLSNLLPSGTYKVRLVQRNPRWYAPDSYYSRRKLLVPPAGSAPRFLKGALGIGAIFLQPLNALNSLLQIPLHCAKEFTEDVAGIQVPEKTYQELQEAVELGNTIVIE